MDADISIAIETSCRAGGLAVGRGEELLGTALLGGTGRHAAELLPALAGLLHEHGLAVSDARRLYVSVGPGSFTGLRVGIATARTLAQALPKIGLRAVPTAEAVAWGLAGEDWDHAGILLAAKERTVHATLFGRDEDRLPQALGEPLLASPEELLADWPTPILLGGEAVGYLDTTWPAGVRLAPEPLGLPQVRCVWEIGRRMERRAPHALLEVNGLLPIYARRPEAVRLWERREKF